MFPGLDLYRTDHAQHILSAGYDLDYCIPRSRFVRRAFVLVSASCFFEGGYIASPESTPEVIFCNKLFEKEDEVPAPSQAC